MQLEALKMFCDVVAFRSFSAAAKANGKTQSALSRVVQDLEEQLGAQLIDRSHRPLELTALGQAYYEGCKELLERYLELEASIRRAGGQMALPIRVAAIYSVGLGDMGQFVERFEAERPHTKVHVDYVHPDRVYERVLEGTADLGLVSFPNESRELTALPWREEEMVVACAPAHPLARRATVRPADLDGEKFVAFDKGLVIRREVDRFLREHGVTVEVALTLDNIESIKKGIEEGAGVSLLPDTMLRREVATGTIRAVPLEGCRLVRPLGIIHRRQYPPGNAVQGFIDLLRGNGTATPPNGAGCNGRAGGHYPPHGEEQSSNGTTRVRRKGKRP
jgi:DNA-binding transcriptional LysR family regulator